MQHGTMVGLLAMAVVMTPSARGQAETPVQVGGLHDLDPVDHHHRPAQYNDPRLTVPPASGADPDYPLAVAFVPAHSSNYTAGGIASYDYVVVHTMQGYYAGSMSWFQNPDANVSAHYVMRSDDGEVTQMVRHEDRAWHVGNSNSYALGIEHEGFIAEPEWYTWETYLSSAQLARWMCEEHSIPVDRDHVVGHVELPNQSHTDPGDFWDWDLYMALIHDVVPEGDVEGVVVDRSMACTITASADTWVKATLETATDLSDDERCMIPAGTALTYLHASDSMVGHVRLHFDQDGSMCAGLLADRGFVFEAHFDALCDPGSMAAATAEVTLDGGAPVVVDAEGRFVISGVAPGAHTLDATGTEYMDGMAPFDVDVYPGARVVIGLDPIPSGGDTGSDESGGDPDVGSSDDLPGGTGNGDDDPSATSTATGTATATATATGTGPDGNDTRSLPPGFGEGEDQGCGCTQRNGGPGLAWMLPWLFLGLARRRAH